MVEFAGWEMPVQFAGIIHEHLAVRRNAGLFDVSHMGQIEVRGSGSLGLLQALTTNDLNRLHTGQAQYTVLTTPAGTCIDDLVIYRIGEWEYLLCVNAANVEKDFQWIREHSGTGVEVTNRSADFGLLALQGPRAQSILSRCSDASLDRLAGFHLARGRVAGVETIITRTGYTGEDGFELYVPSTQAGLIWDHLLEEGAVDGLEPIGLGARDTLRLEARLLLHGSDLDETTTAWEAGLRRFIRFDKGAFPGREILLAQSRKGPERLLAGFEMIDPGIPRHGYGIIYNGKTVGHVTSGGHAPFLRKNIGLGYLPLALAEAGQEVEVEIRGRTRRAKIVKGPFYRRPARTEPVK